VTSAKSASAMSSRPPGAVPVATDLCAEHPCLALNRRSAGPSAQVGGGFERGLPSESALDRGKLTGVPSSGLSLTRRARSPAANNGRREGDDKAGITQVPPPCIPPSRRSSDAESDAVRLWRTPRLERMPPSRHWPHSRTAQAAGLLLLAPGCRDSLQDPDKGLTW
jgi:hypothetical protein